MTAAVSANALAPSTARSTRRSLAARLLGLLSLALGMVSSAHAAPGPGDADPAFNGTGFTTVAIHSTGDSRAKRVLVQPDGKLVLAAQCSAPGIEMPMMFCLTRVLPNGSLDSTFGGGSAGVGRVITPIGNANGEGDTLTALALQADGKIVAAGACVQISGASPAILVRFCIARYLPDGALDPAFNGSGIVVTPAPSTQKYARGSSLVIQPDGKLLMGGWCISATGFDWNLCLTRYLPNGALDSAGFIASAPAAVDRGKLVFSLGGSNNNTFPALAVQTDGRIVVGGSCVGPVQQSPTYCVARFNADGSTDTTWAGATHPNEASIPGLVRTLISYDGYPSSLLIQPDNHIVVVGNCRVSATQLVMFCAARLRPDGSLDLTFGNGGSVLHAMNSPRYSVGGKGYGGPYRVLQQSDGKLLLAGICAGDTATSPSYQGSQACMLRMHANGELDNTFFQELQFYPRSGLTFDAPGIPYSVNDIALQSDGRIALAGEWMNTTTQHTEAYVARLLGGSNDNTQCSADIDGDGVVGPTDSTLLARAALGFRGNALTEGITFAAHAARKTSVAVRDYLFNHCKMALTP